MIEGALGEEFGVFVINDDCTANEESKGVFGEEIGVLGVIDDGSVKEEEFGVLETTDDRSVDKGFKGVFGEERVALGITDDCSVKEFGVSVTTDACSVHKGSKGTFGEERGVLGRTSDCLVKEDEELVMTESRGASGEEVVCSVMTDDASELKELLEADICSTDGSVTSVDNEFAPGSFVGNCDTFSHKFCSFAPLVIIFDGSRVFKKSGLLGSSSKG